MGGKGIPQETLLPLAINTIDYSSGILYIKGMMTELAKNQPFQEIAEKGAAIYATKKSEYEPKDNGKFLAIEVENSTIYKADTSAEALENARKENPGKLFYVVKVGSDSAETLAHSLVGRL